MPRPPILPTIDWSKVFAEGKTFSDWLAAAEDPAQREKMQAGYKDLGLPPHFAAALAKLPKKVHVIAIAEDWCGDVVRQTPVLQVMADAGGAQIAVRYVSRSYNPDLFARYLTNGGEAIPKFIFLSDKFVECGNWGPMPARHKEWVARGKAFGDVAAARTIVKALTNADVKRTETFSELMHMFDIASTAGIAAI